MTRIATVDRELCKPKNCLLQCRKVCPLNRSGEECITIDETGFPVIDENICIGCGLCVNRCERSGFKALTIVNLPEQLKEKPIHRFGKNQFSLFRLPFPVPDRIVGLVGSNGLGKTTALRVLSGEIKPNLGEVGRKLDFSELITMFRGTELQNYLEKLRDRQIKVSYKLQRVDKVASIYSGKVSKLLGKTDERMILNDLIEKFDLENILDKKIDEISGGELQRVAVAACLAKDADIYYLDEFTSFLDVFQRLKVSRVITESCKGRSVVIVDHDLATLDFLADAVHVFYGVPGVYGIVSSPYSVRVGINAFLDGFIKEDNVRIRPQPIVFERSFLEKEGRMETLISFENIQKELGSFRLNVKTGEVFRGVVLGILGANALGKTTLARIIAGEFKQDSGNINGKVKVSYKSQYPRTEFDGTVRELLRSVSKGVESTSYKSEIIRPLGLEKLLEKKVNKLSGGELQRTAIAVALSQEADVYLLDEPSAFLDVEQRLSLAKMIRSLVEKKEVSVLIVDHDLLFLNQTSNRAMVFLGEAGIEGYAERPTNVRDAFNTFLSKVDVTFRTDPQTGRPRANKLDSKMDRLQKEKGEYFLS